MHSGCGDRKTDDPDDQGRETWIRDEQKYFITGTGTDVGKTYVTGLIVKKLKESGADAAYYKAAMSGNERRPDGSLIPGMLFR